MNYKQMNHKIWLPCALLFAVAASPARAQQPPALTFDAQTVANESETAFAGRAADLRRVGDWNQLGEIGRVRRTAHPEQTVGWNAEALGAYGNGDVEAAIVAWKAAPDLKTIPDGPKLLANAQAIQRNYPGRRFEPLQFIASDIVAERLRWQNKAAELLMAKDYDGIERTAGELLKSKQTDAFGKTLLQSFFVVLSEPDDDEKPLKKFIAEWRAAKPNSDLARLADIEFSTRMAWRARGGGYVNTITPGMSETMNDELGRGAQAIAELSPAANESPLTFKVLRDWGQIGGNGRPFQDAVYQEGRARFPTDTDILGGRLTDLLPQWYGVEGELPQVLQEHSDKIGGAEGDIDYALGYLDVRTFRPDAPLDDARFWRGLELLRARFPDSVELRVVQLRHGETQGKRDGNYEHAKSALSEPKGYLLDGYDLEKPESRAQATEARMNILSKPKPQPNQ